MLSRHWRPKIKKSHLEVEFRHAFSSGRFKVIEAMEAVVKIAEVIEATEAVHQRIMLQKDVRNQILKVF